METRDNRKVAVVIPFFQREPGILTRALDTVAAQTYRNVHVVVVDDNSPLHPEAEIAARPEAELETISLVRQPNGGPGAARNTGLDAIPPGTDTIAFLDSDDRWEPRHLERAVEGLNAGFDFFFADYAWPNATTTCFRRAGIDLGAPAIREGSVVRALDADFYEMVLTCWPVHISATVIDAHRLGHIRFDPRLRFSSEDMRYFLECARASDRVCLSTELGVRLDDGANIFRRQAVGSYGFSRSRLGNAYFHRMIDREAAARGRAVRAVNRRLLRTNYKDFLRSEAKSLIRERRLNIGLYADFARIVLGRDVAPGG